MVGALETAAAAIGLVLRDLVRLMNLAMVDAAGVDVKGQAEFGLAHHRTFQVPARRAAAPRRIPFHLPRLPPRLSAPDRELGGLAPAPPLAYPAPHHLAATRHPP